MYPCSLPLHQSSIDEENPVLNYNLKALLEFLEALFRHPLASLMVLRKLPRMVRGLVMARNWQPDQARAIPQDQQISTGSMAAWLETKQGGRGIMKWRHHIESYDEYFQRFRGKPVHVVEIGVHSGGSLEMWRNYFGMDCLVYDIDIHEDCRAYENQYTRIFIGDQADRSFWTRFRQQVPHVDILIDDGGHTFEQQAVTIEEMLHHIAPGGLYACEDIFPSRNSFAAYLYGLIAALNDVDEKHVVSGRHTPFQAAIASIHFLPYLILIKKHDQFSGIRFIKKGEQWNPLQT